MIFSNNAWINTIGQEQVAMLRTGGIICVYQGEQPSAADYVANYNTLYDFSGPNILQLILKNPHDRAKIITDPDDPKYTQGLKSFNAGTATWASIHYNASFQPEYNIEGYYTISDATVNGIQVFIKYNQPGSGSNIAGPELKALENFLIVPVSSLIDNGVIKFITTEFSHPDEGDEDRALDMSITVSAQGV